MEHYLARVREYLERQEQTPEVIELLNEVPKPRRARLILDYDLRTDQVIKSLDCINSRDYSCFVNKARTLVHVMIYGHPGILIRLPRLNMKEFSRKKMQKTILELLYEVE